jgi:hypothetical protein
MSATRGRYAVAGRRGGRRTRTAHEDGEEGGKQGEQRARRVASGSGAMRAGASVTPVAHGAYMFRGQSSRWDTHGWRSPRPSSRGGRRTCPLCTRHGSCTRLGTSAARNPIPSSPGGSGRWRCSRTHCSSSPKGTRLGDERKGGGGRGEGNACVRLPKRWRSRCLRGDGRCCALHFSERAGAYGASSHST